MLRLIIVAALVSPLLVLSQANNSSSTCSNATLCDQDKKSTGVPLEVLVIIPGFGLLQGFALMYCSKKRGDSQFKKWLAIGLILNVFGMHNYSSS
jgi:hypothetical protein